MSHHRVGTTSPSSTRTGSRRMADEGPLQNGKVKTASLHTQMEPGREGPQVGVLKDLLAAHGFEVEGEPRNVYGPKTKAAVKAYQRTLEPRTGRSTEPSGSVDGKTWASLYGLEGKAATKAAKTIDKNGGGTFIQHFIADNYEKSMKKGAERPTDRQLHHNMVITAALAEGLSMDKAIRVSRRMNNDKAISKKLISDEKLASIASRLYEESDKGGGKVSGVGYFYGGADVNDKTADAALRAVAATMLTDRKGARPDVAKRLGISMKKLQSFLAEANPQ